MKTFHEWLADKHPEMLDEGILQDLANSKLARNLVAGATITAGGLGFGAGAANAAAPKPRPAATRAVDDEDDSYEIEIARQERDAAKLLAAAKRAGVPEREWNMLRTDDAAGGVIVRVNGRDVPLTPREKEIVRDAKEQKAEYDRMMAGAGGAGRAGVTSGAVPSRPTPSKATPPKPAPSKASPARGRLPGGVGQSPNWSPE